MHELLIKQIDDFVQKYKMSDAAKRFAEEMEKIKEQKREKAPTVRYITHHEPPKQAAISMKTGKQLKPYLKYGGKLLPREEVERKKQEAGLGMLREPEGKRKYERIDAKGLVKNINNFIANNKTGVIEEIGQQLTPKGPGYTSPADISEDVKESQRLGGKVKGLFKPKKV